MLTTPEPVTSTEKALQSKPVLSPELRPIATDQETIGFHKGFAPAGPARKVMLTLIPLDFTEGLVGLIVLLMWILMFASGIVIPTATYREILGQKDIGFGAAMGALFYVVTCYTVTNVALLACFSGFLGGLARRAKIAGNEPNEKSPESHDYLTAVMRGFFIYLVLLSGLILLTTQAITSPTQDQYIRLAGTISVMAFIAGYDPEVFSRILMKVSDVAQGQGSRSEKQTSTQVRIDAKEITKETSVAGTT